MKTSFINRFAIVLFSLASLISVTSCDKDDHDHDHDGTGHMHIYFNNRYGLTDALEYNTVKTGANGRNFTVNLNHYYISNVVLVDHDGNEVPLTGQYLLAKNGEENELDIEELPTGHYTQIRFSVGIDSVTNHADPSTYPATSPLALQVPSMHWSWSTGYIFFKLEGLVDTSATKTGPVDAPWLIHLGTDAKYTTVTLPIDKVVDADSHPGININLNIAALFNNIDLGGADIATMTMDNQDLANRFKANFATAFTVE